MHVSLLAYCVAATAVLVGSVVQGSTGMGLNMIAAPFVAIVVPDALPATLVLVALPLAVSTLVREHYALDRQALPWLLLGAVVEREVVRGAVDGAPRPERVEVLAQEVELQRVGVVVVDLLALLVREVPLRAVVMILLEEDAGALRQRLQDRAGDGALAGAGAPGDA
jgi:hypothetical protein